MPQDAPRVAVVGAGLIGQAWALVFARGGCDVTIWDGDAAALRHGLATIGELASALQRERLLDDARAVTERIAPAASLEEAVAGADYVQESLPERVEVKREIFSRMDAVAPAAAILASSTSSIAASRFTRDLAGRERCLVAHPVNPPYLVPVVELCGAPWTQAQVMERARELLTRVGQKPVTVHGEPEGFVLNRLQGALLREAFRLVQQGVISAEDLDTTVRDGLGLRWSFMGPLETIDLNAPGGIRDYCERYGGLYASIAREQADCSPWPDALITELEAQRRQRLAADQLAARRLWRDERLMALMRHKRTQGAASHGEPTD